MCFSCFVCGCVAPRLPWALGVVRGGVVEGLVVGHGGGVALLCLSPRPAEPLPPPARRSEELLLMSSSSNGGQEASDARVAFSTRTPTQGMPLSEYEHTGVSLALPPPHC